MPTELHIRHTESAGRGQFYIGDDERRPDAAMMYHRWGGGQTVNVDHTEVGDALRGEGVGLKLLEALVAWAKAEDLEVSATCPFAVAMFERHPELGEGVHVAYEDERRGR